jgi:hypothetical protein
VKPAQDAPDSVVPADFFGVLRDAADAAVGAAGDEPEALRGLIADRGVVEKQVAPRSRPADGIPRLEGELRRDLPQKNQMLGKARRLAGKGELGPAAKLGGVHREPDGRAAVKVVFLQCQRVGDDPGAFFPAPLQEEGQPPGVVLVAVGQDDGRDLREVQPQLVGVFQEHVGVARVQQQGKVSVLQKAAEGRLPQKILIDKGVVVRKNGELHRMFLPACVPRTFFPL